jgi:chromosomal replication initiator protein
MISPQSLLGRLRFKEFCQPRHMAYLLAYELTYQSLTDIGQAMDRDHTTILHGVRTMRIAIKKDPALALAYQELTAALGAAHEVY